MNAGIKGPRKRRAPKHRSRRERYAQEGLLLQVDASYHDWLEGREPKMALIGAIGDATGKVVHALFRQREDSEGYFRLLQRIAAEYGLPHALYHDGHSIFVSPRDELPSIEEQLAGKKHHTQFGRLLEELGITSIQSLSHQARGRVERLWGTFQDRLVSEFAKIIVFFQWSSRQGTILYLRHICDGRLLPLINSWITCFLNSMLKFLCCLMARSFFLHYRLLRIPPTFLTQTVQLQGFTPNINDATVPY